MPNPMTREQRYRDIAAECRERASSAKSSKTRAAFEMLAGRYDEMAEVEHAGGKHKTAEG
jgi:hypothetical protein